MSAQRFHTNQSPICKALQADGHEVKFFVQARGMAEDHTVLVPTQMKLSLLGKLIDRRLKKKYDETTYESMLTERFIPSLWWTYREVKGISMPVRSEAKNISFAEVLVMT